MKLYVGISLIYHLLSIQLRAQTVNFYDSWKLVKITENEIIQQLDGSRIMLIDPNGIMAYYDIALDSIVVNGTWKRQGFDIIIIDRGTKTKYLIRVWTDTEIVLSPMNNLNRYYYYSRLRILKSIVNFPKL